ncbi:hypothetical protein D1007_26132 [Hordeum vulgare]|nr:hypothetical protein D1007_26132 [Hordeum vulgare]
MYRVGSDDHGSNVGLFLNDIARAYENKGSRQEQRLQQIGYTGDNLKMMRQGPFKGSPLAFNMRGPSRGSPMAFKIVNEISNALRMSPRCAEECRHEERKDFTGSMTDESNNCKIPLATLKGKQPTQKQVVYRDGYCNSKNVEVEGVQVLGFTGTRETDNNNIREVDRIEGGNNVREVVMDWTSSSDGTPTADKQASYNSSVRNELIPGHERDGISSDNDDDPNGDTLDSIDIGKGTQEEKEMDDMFKGSAFPSIEEVTQAREPEDGLNFKTRDDAFFFFCAYAKNIGFSVKRSTTRRAGPEQEVDNQVFHCTKEDEYEGSWKRAISKYKAEGNRHLNALWELRIFWVPAYFKDCFYPFSSTTKRNESTNSMWKNYVNHKDTITMFVGAYNIMQQNCLATLHKERHQTEKKVPSRETGFPLETEASEIYTNEIFRKFQRELRNRTYYKCHDLAKGRQYLLKRMSSQDKDRKPYTGEEFDRSDFRVDVDEHKEIYTCSCKKMTRDGIQCCHTAMNCNVCSNLGCHGGESVVDHSFMIIPLPRCYESYLYAPCYYRKQVLSLISFWQDEALDEGFQNDGFNLVFGTGEELSYNIKFTDSADWSKFHGPGWEKIIHDYDLCYGDINKLDLQGKDFFFHNQMELNEALGSHKAVPNPSIDDFIVSALEDLGISQRNYLDKTLYTRGIQLSYTEMVYVTSLVLSAKDTPLIAFVHCLNFSNVHQGRLKIPTIVARALRMKVGYFPLKGSIKLVELSSSVEFPRTYCLHKDGRLAISGFSALTNAAELTIDSVVLFTINKGVVVDKELLSLVVTDLYRKTV